jgi:hypothetical protein
VRPARASAPHANAIIVSIAATMKGREFSGREISKTFPFLVGDFFIGIPSKRLGIVYTLVEIG